MNPQQKYRNWLTGDKVTVIGQTNKTVTYIRDNELSVFGRTLSKFTKPAYVFAQCYRRTV